MIAQATFKLKTSARKSLSFAVLLLVAVKQGAGLGLVSEKGEETAVHTRCAAAVTWLLKTQQRGLSQNKHNSGVSQHRFLHFNKLFCAKSSREQIISWRNPSPISYQLFFFLPFFPNKRPYIQQYLGTY